MHVEHMQGLQRPKVTTACPELHPALKCTDFKMATASQRPWTSKALIAAAAGTAIFLIGKGLRVSIGKPACLPSPHYDPWFLKHMQAGPAEQLL